MLLHNKKQHKTRQHTKITCQHRKICTFLAKLVTRTRRVFALPVLCWVVTIRRTVWCTNQHIWWATVIDTQACAEMCCHAITMRDCRVTESAISCNSFWGATCRLLFARGSVSLLFALRHDHRRTLMMGLFSLNIKTNNKRVKKK